MSPKFISVRALTLRTVSLRSATLRIIALILLSTLMAACDEDNQIPQLKFESMGLDGHIVSQFASNANDSTLYAATDKGLYKLGSTGSWQRSSPQSWDIKAVVVLYPDHLLASIAVDGDYRLMESLNSGLDWHLVEHNFGELEDISDREPILQMQFDDTSARLYAVGYDVLAMSDDFGREWNVVDGEWGVLATGLSVLRQHPDTLDFWIGGQGAIENPVLRQVDLSGAMTVDHSQEISELLEFPSVVKGIRFLDNDAERILVAGEGGIIQSHNYGESWQPLLLNATSRFYFDVLSDPDHDERLYTAGWDKNFDEPQALSVQLSLDDGQHWITYRYSSNTLRGGVWAMTLRKEGTRKFLYLGLCNGGIFRAEIIEAR